MFQENCTISSEDKSYSWCKLELWLYISNTTKPVSNSEDEIKYLWKPMVQNTPVLIHTNDKQPNRIYVSSLYN